MPPRSRTKRKATAVPETSNPPRPKRQDNRELPLLRSKTQNTVACLDMLPDELIMGILELMMAECLDLELYQSDFIPTCLNLGLTSRRLHRLAMLYLYQTNDTSHRTNGAPFLRTVVDRSDLAAYVKHISWEYNEAKETREMIHGSGPAVGAYNEIMTPKPRPDECRRMRLQLRRFHVPQRHKWSEGFKEGRSSSLLALTLLYTPNIRTLCVFDEEKEEFTRSPLWLQTLCQVACGTPVNSEQHFQFLKTLCISIGYIRAPLISTLMTLPSLRTLRLGELLAPKRTGSWNCPPRTSTVEELFLDDCVVCTEVISQFVSSCRALRVLSVEFDTAPGPPWMWEPPLQLNYQNMAVALNDQKQSLESLIIKYSTEADDEIRDHPGYIGSFHEFEKLSSIYLPYRALDDTQGGRLYICEKLPNCLKWFHLSVDTDDVKKSTAALHDLATCFQSQFRSLNHVGLFFNSALVRFPIQPVNQIKEHFAKGDVAFHVTHYWAGMPRFHYSAEYDEDDIPVA